MKTVFFRCSKCGKKLIGRRPNGIFAFLFGGKAYPPLVQIEIFGHVRMRCIRRSCRKNYPDHWNVFNYFPEGFSIASGQAIDVSKPPQANPAEKKQLLTT